MKRALAFILIAASFALAFWAASHAQRGAQTDYFQGVAGRPA